MIHAIIFDWKRTLYDPDKKTLIDGAEELLSYLHKKRIPLFLIGKGGQDMYSEVDKLNVRKFFSEIIFQEGKKEAAQFVRFVSPENPQHTIFIGDRAKSELAIGAALGANTIWIRQGKFADEEPENKEPTYVVTNLKECRNLLEKILRSYSRSENCIYA